MANLKRLGIFFGSTGLSIVEILNRKISGQYFMSFQASEEETAAAGNVSPEIRLTAALQKSLRDNKIDLEDVWVSLPTKEFIVRSFSLPLLSKEEIGPAVEFEVRKYIPFKLEDLIFDYQISTFMEGRVKKSKVLFMGIKRNILERYIYIFQQAELRISFIEPSAVSLLRLFLVKRFFSLNQTAVLIETNLGEGTIMVAEQGLPQLIRDFKFTAAPPNDFSTEADSEFSHLLNEIRISLEYYRRQNPRGSINKLIFSSSGELKKWTEGISRELKVPAFHYTHLETLGIKDGADYSTLAAYGVGLAEEVRTPLSVDLAKKRFRTETKISKALIKEAIPLKDVVKYVAIAVLVIGLFSSFSIAKISDLQTQLMKLKKADVEVSNISEKELKVMISTYENKVSMIKEAVVTSLISSKIYSIPLLLPDNMWLTALSIKFDSPDSKVITVKGTVLFHDANRELNLINKFILNLKQSEEMSKDFKKISLVSATSNQSPEQGGTNFEIICR